MNRIAGRKTNRKFLNSLDLSITAGFTVKVDDAYGDQTRPAVRREPHYLALLRVDSADSSATAQWQQLTLLRRDRRAEIATLRGHQRAILKLLQSKALGKAKMISKEKWVSIMRACGFTEEQMMRWHAEFERSAPGEHQEFLEFLNIPADEIANIRKQSRTQAT